MRPATEFLKQNPLYGNIYNQVEVCGRNVLYFVQDNEIVDIFTVCNDMANAQSRHAMPFELVYINWLLTVLSTKLQQGVDTSIILSALEEYNNFKHKKTKEVSK